MISFSFLFFSLLFSFRIIFSFLLPPFLIDSYILFPVGIMISGKGLNKSCFMLIAFFLSFRQWGIYLSMSMSCIFLVPVCVGFIIPVVFVFLFRSGDMFLST